MDTLSLTKEGRIYNGVKTISLTIGAGKTGQPLVKNETKSLSNTTHKNKLIAFLIVTQVHLFLHHSPFGPVVFTPHRLLWSLKKEKKYI